MHTDARASTHAHTHYLNIFWNYKFTRCDSVLCGTQNFIFKHLSTKQQPHMCPLTKWMVSFLLVLRFYIYNRSVLALPENVSVSSRHKKNWWNSNQWYLVFCNSIFDFSDIIILRVQIYKMHIRQRPKRRCHNFHLLPSVINGVSFNNKAYWQWIFLKTLNH